VVRVRLICWNPGEARERAEMLGSSGITIEYGPFERETMRALRENPPDAIVIDLDRIPSQGRDLAVLFRKGKATRFIPIVFAAGDPEKVRRIRGLLPDAAYTGWDEIHGVLKGAIENPPDSPVVPESVFQAYATTPLPKKLGIKMGMRVLLVGAPEGFEDTLDGLPDAVEFVRQPDAENDLVIWFARSRNEIEEGMEDIKRLTGGGGLWIAWPKKASGVVTDLTQTVVREVGLDSGLVDYKISSISDIWSCLRFSKREPQV